MDFLLRFDVNERSEHQRHDYSTIYGKIIYPVAFNPLNDKKEHIISLIAIITDMR